MSIVYGFAGLRIKEEGLLFSPGIPDAWNAYRFRIRYRDSLMQIDIDKSAARFTLLSGTAKKLRVYGKTHTLADSLEIPLRN
jgi:alpha,alpha-trehalose phosphorylase